MLKHSALLIILLLLFSTIANANNAYEKALQSFNENQIDEAYIHLKRSLQQDPKHLPSKILMGKTLFSKGLARDALIEFDESIAMGADINLIIVDLAKVHLYLADYEKIVELSEISLSRSNTFELLLIKGTAAFNTNKDEQAIDYHEQAIALYPQNARAIQSLAYIYLYKGMYEQLEILIAKLIGIDPNNYKTLHLQSQLANTKGQTQITVSLLERAQSINPSDPLIKRSLANAYISSNQKEKAVEVLKAILAQTPDDPFAVLLFAKLVESSDTAASESSFIEIAQKLSLLPDSLKSQRPELVFVQALSTYMTKNYGQASRELESYLVKNKEDLSAISVLADTYIKLNQEYKALTLLEENQRVIENDLRLNILLCDMYIRNQKDFKCESIIRNLEIQLGKNNPNVVFTRIKTLQQRNRNEEALELYEKLFGNQEGDVFTYTAIELLKVNSRYPEALAKVDKLLETDANNTRALIERSDILNSMGEFESSIEILKPMLEQTPENLNAGLSLAVAYLRTQKFIEADQIVTRLLIGREQNTSLLLLKSQIELANNNNSAAIEILLKIKASKAKKKYASELLVQAYKNSGEFKNAISELTLLLKDNFLEPTYLIERAKLFAQNHETEKASRDFNTLFGLWAKQSNRLLQLFYLQTSINDLAGAERSLNTALLLSPENLLLRIETVRLKLRQNDPEAANTLINTLLKDFPSNKTVRLLSGEVALRLGRTEQAHAEFKFALDSDNRYSLAAVKLYQLAIKGYKAKEFELMMSNILANNPDILLIENLLADFKVLQGRGSEAAQHYLNITNATDYPNLAIVYNNLANIFLNSYSDLNKAEQYVKKALLLQPNSAAIIDTQGWILAQQGSYQEALTYLRRAFTLASEDSQIRYHLAYTLYHLGRVTEANREIAFALKDEDALFDKQKALELKAKIIEKL